MYTEMVVIRLFKGPVMPCLLGLRTGNTEKKDEVCKQIPRTFFSLVVESDYAVFPSLTESLHLNTKAGKRRLKVLGICR